MPSGHNDIRRLVYRSLEEVYASMRIGREAGVSEGVNAFRAKLDLQVMNRNGFQEPSTVRNRLVRKHEAVLTYLESRFGDFYASYDYEKPLSPVPDGMEDKIWLCWWQGLESAPEIVKVCVESVCRNAAGRDVVLVTDENVADYVDIPDWMMEKVKSGIASRTNLSDLLRLSLLAKYGGIWLDATFFCCRPLDRPIYDAPLFSIKRPDYLHGSIAAGFFAGYSLGCDADNRRAFEIAKDFFLEYWHRSDFLIDYLLVDYLIVLSQRHCRVVEESFAAIEPNNPLCDELLKVLSEPYDDEKWSELKSGTDLFKLSWKYDYSMLNGGKATYFARLMRGMLK